MYVRIVYSRMFIKSNFHKRIYPYRRCYRQPHVASTIIGATSLSQLQENIQAYNKINLLTDEVVTAIDGIYKRYRDPAKI